MKILAMDTAMAACSVALLSDGVIAGHCYIDQRRGHAETLMGMVGEVLKSAQTSFAEIDRFAVTKGPGTFTGLRVGLSSARGYGVASGKPVLGFSTLQTLARALAPEISPECSEIAVIFDARGDEVYAQFFDRTWAPLTEPGVSTRADVADQLSERGNPKQTALIGTGAALIADMAPGLLLDVNPQPDAQCLGLLAAALDDPDLAPPIPLYLREADAKRSTKNPLAR